MAYNRQQQDSVAARVNSDRADWEMSNPNEFTHGTHDRNLNPATPAASNLALHWRVTLTAAIGFAMGFIGAFYSDMLLDLIHYYGDF